MNHTTTKTTTSRPRLAATLTLLLLLTAACQDDAPSTPPPDAGVVDDASGDAGAPIDVDASSEPDDAGTLPDADASCAPVTECPVGACGPVDDGCGGVLECAPCQCADGELVAADTSCGVCGLGTLECAPGATGAAECVGPPPGLLGFDDDATAIECDAQLVYLDPQAVPGGSGTADDPMADLARAYGLARDRALEGAEGADTRPTLLVMASGTLEHTGPLFLGERVSIAGGFSRDASSGWTYDLEGQRRTQVLIRRAEVDVTTLGVLARDLSGHTVVSHVDLVVDDALDASLDFSGGSSVGLWALDAPGLTLRHAHITAGAGGQGAHGFDGLDGGAGSPGGGGPLGTNQGVLTNPTSPGFAPSTPNLACQMLRGTPDGGRGGRGGGACAAGMTTPCRHFEATWRDALEPELGERGLGSRGGQGGAPVAGGPNRYASAAGVVAGDGAPGRPGDEGADGGGGVAGGISRDDVIWDPRGQGDNGAPGRNGGGGGGGGGVEYLYFNDTDWFFGPGGGAGGSGGCGGEGGQGGKAGGGSVGARLVRSPITLEHVVLEARMGGAGGDGGAGGVGGPGGQGGPGTSMLSAYANFGQSQAPPTQLDGNARSGDGGAGARGGDGGHGGGGAGGASFGLYCLDSPGLDLVDVTAITAGSAPGGAGPGEPGERGLSQQTTGCP